MKHLLLAVAMVMSSLSYAGFSKNSPQLNALGAAWKSTSTTKPSQHNHDLTIVYGGADVISNSPVAAQSILGA